MQKKERIAQLLANGVPASEIGHIVGTNVAYLNALQQDAEFKDFVLFYTENQEESKDVEDERLDDKYVSLENKLVRTLSAEAGLMDHATAVRLLSTVADRNDKRRAGLHQASDSSGVTHVIINVSARALERPAFQLSAEKEVVSIAGRDIAPMSMEGVSALIEAKRALLVKPVSIGEATQYENAEELAASM